jgi:membrane-associated phospholipid phosphatase
MLGNTKADAPVDDRAQLAELQTFAATSRLCWAITALVTVIVLAFVATGGIAYDASTWPINALVFPLFGVVGLVYTYVRRDIVVASIADAVSLLAGYTLVAAVFTYVTTIWGADRPFWDARFLAADRALGFDWVGWLTWLNKHPTLARVLEWTYGSVLKQIPILILCLAVMRRHRRLQVVLLSLQLSLIVCALGAYFVPAIGTYEHLGIQEAVHHPDIALTARDLPVAEVHQLRGSAPVVAMSRIEGVIVFPSFHMVLAIVLAWGFWAVPYLRWPALALNLAMAASTPLSGGHYLVDLIAGTVVALTALAAAGRIRATIEDRYRVPREPQSGPGAVPVPAA